MNAKLARALGQRAVDVRPHRRPAHRQAAPADQEGRRARAHADAARTERRRGVHLLRRADRRRPAHAHDRPDRGGPGRGRREPRRASPGCARTASAGSSARPSRPTARTIDIDAPCRGERDRRLVRRHPGVRRGQAPDTIRPAKGIHITVPWSKVRNDIAAIVPVPKDKRSIFVVPWGDLTYIGTTDTDYDGPLDDPQCTPEDVDYLLNAMNLVMTEPLTKDDVVGTWAGLRPLIAGGSVGEKTADLSRVHKVLTSPRRADHGRPAASSRPTGAWPPTPSTRSCRTLGRGGKSVDQEAAARSARPRRRAPRSARGSAPSDDAPGAPVRQPAARRSSTSSATTRRSRRAARARAAVPQVRGDLRGARRDGHDARRRAVAPDPRPAARPRRDVGRRRGRRAADRARARLGRRADRDRGRVVPGHARRRARGGRAARARLSTNRSALDRLRAPPPRRSRSRLRPTQITGRLTARARWSSTTRCSADARRRVRHGARRRRVAWSRPAATGGR